MAPSSPHEVSNDVRHGLSANNDAPAIAIISMAGRFPGAASLADFWNNLVRGVDSVCHFNDEELEVPHAARGLPGYVKARSILTDVDAFDAGFFGIYPREAEQMDPQHRIFLECAWEALERAGHNPDAFPGLIGVFAGCSMNTYFMHNLVHDRAYLAAFAEGYQSTGYTTMLGNDKDFLPTRVSYKLNLRGPSLSIQTACSTSLVAVAQACQSLLTYSCDMALAGGVSITFPQRRGYVPEEGGILSTDGCIRPFDKQANGTVFGDGAGVVVLKRLTDAITDNDTVLAVIRGFAVNNDGAERAGYTAPSREGQAQVIASAQAMAGFDPATISYIEAHGTATPLGDPIELAGLTQAFRTATTRRQYCALGTAKSNIGHLDVASGVVGLIKTVLQMQHLKIPGLLHFSEANQGLLLDESPFVIHTETTDWQPVDGMLRAGVSSFGVGGTNAHVVLEAPDSLSPLASRSSLSGSGYAQILPLSARTPAALAAMQAQLAAYLEACPTPPGPEQDSAQLLENVAYTLQVGRKEFACRRAFVAVDPGSAVTLLRAPLPAQAETAHTAADPRSHRVAFLFPGQGTQALGMGRLLFEQFPVFRQIMEVADQLVRPWLTNGLIQLLYPPQTSSTAHAPAPPPIQAHKLLHQTGAAQPAIFAVSYALAKLWQSFGVQPALLIGHSIGEFVAAALAGTLSFADALMLVAARGFLIEQLPTGAMLAIRASEQEILPHLHPRLDVASFNGPKAIVVAGTHQDVEALAGALGAAGIAARKLSTSHAFHSRMMDAALEPFSHFLEKVSFHEPVLPWISTLTGERVQPGQVTRTDYWLRQLRSPVLFAKAAKVATTEGATVFLEVGPGQTLTNLIKQNGLACTSRPAVATLPVDPGDSGELLSPLSTPIARLWESGVAIDWRPLHADGSGLRADLRRIPLPTYPFERKRYWVDPPSELHSREHRNNASSPVDRQTVGTESISIPPEALSMLASTPGTPQEQTITGLIIAALKTIVTELSDLDLAETPAHISWMELGLDSLFLTQLTQAIRNNYGVKLTFRQIMGEYSSFASLASHLAAVAPKDKLPVPKPSMTPIAGDIPSQATSNSWNPQAAQPQHTDGYAALFSQQMAAMSALMQRQMEMLATLSGAKDPAANAEVLASPASESPEIQAPAFVSSLAPSSGSAEAHLGTLLPSHRTDTATASLLTTDQARYVDSLLDRYHRKTAKSKSNAQRYRDVLADPRVASGFNQQFKEAVYPIVVERAKGAYLWDLDGNRYIDILNGYGSILFGHSPEFVVEALQRQLTLGFPVGPQTELAGECAELLTSMVGMDRATFCNTGSEAVMAALRLARTVTGRSLVVVFAGSYHGQIDEVLVKSTRSERSIPTAPGIPQQSVANMLVLEYGSAPALEVMRRRASEIAAVLVEPVQSRHPELQPVAFLREVRTITEQAGAALIFDEVVTGFRTGSGGAQERFDIRADLATYGKVVAGGMPVGVVAGSRTYMDALDGGTWQFGDDSAPQVGVTFFAGTFVRHPLTMAAVKATLEHLRLKGPGLQTKLASTTAGLVDDLNVLFEAFGFPARIRHFASWFYFSVPPEARLARLLYIHLREQGVHLQEGFPCFLSTAHTEEDLENVRQAFRVAVHEMRAHGVLDGPADKQPVGPVAPSLISASVETSSVERCSVAAVEEASITASQREILLASQLGDEASCAFNESVTLYLSGKLDQTHLRAALQQVVARHDALRMAVGRDGETIGVSAEMPVHLEQHDWRTLDTAEQESRLRYLLQNEATTPFNLKQAPLFRCSLVLLADDQAALVFTGHHIIVDGWSINQIFAEWGLIYSSLIVQDTTEAHHTPKLLPAKSFLEHARLEHTRSRQAGIDTETEAYWLQTYRTLPPLLALPVDRPRPALRTHQGSTLRRIFPTELVAALRRVSARQGVTLFSTLLSGYAVLLSRLTSERDIVVTIPVAAQSNFSGESFVGHAVQFLPLRIDAAPDSSFGEIAAQVQGKVYDALDHQHYTLGTLMQKLKVPRDPARLLLGEAQFNLEQVGADLHYEGLRTRLDTNPKTAVNADIFFNFIDGGNGDGGNGNRGKGLALECDYNTALFDQSTIERWIDCLQVLLEDAAASVQQPIARLRWLTDASLQQIVVDWNDTATTYPSELPVHVVFEQQTRKTPQAIALRFGSRSLTYNELDEQADRFCRFLLRAHASGGLASGKALRIGLCLERSPEFIIAILGTLKAGGLYIPMDPGYPPARLSMLLDDAEPSLLVTQYSLRENLPDSIPTLFIEELFIEALEAGPALPSSESQHVPVTRPIAAGSAAYMMYTSGSTGRPKGVVIPHRAITRLVLGTDFIRFAPDEVFLQLAPVSFDASTLEIWGALLHGSTLVIMPGSRPSPEEIGEAIQHYGVTTLWLTAALFHLMVMDHLPLLAPLRQLVAGGDVLSVSHVSRVLEALPGLRLVNGYGPTENTTFTCCHTITRDSLSGASIPIGRPIANTRVYILDKDGMPVPVGVPGELHAAGDGLALGYWKAPSQNAEKFIELALPLVGTKRLYRTGDLARYHPDGSIEFLGRKDDQIKVRGFRIEPREIEATAERFSGVRSALVAARPDWTTPMDVPGDVRLVLYVLLEAALEFSQLRGQLQDFLREQLPDAMQPAAIVQLKEFPRTINGKLDHRALPLPIPGSKHRPSAAEAAAPRSTLESELASIWCKVLQLDNVGVHDSIFELGGDSLSIFRITSLANQAGIGMTAQHVFQYKTIAALSPRLEEVQASLAGPAPDRPTIRAVPREQFRRASSLDPVEP